MTEEEWALLQKQLREEEEERVRVLGGQKGGQEGTVVTVSTPLAAVASVKMPDN